MAELQGNADAAVAEAADSLGTTLGELAAVPGVGKVAKTGVTELVDTAADQARKNARDWADDAKPARIPAKKDVSPGLDVDGEMIGQDGPTYSGVRGSQDLVPDNTASRLGRVEGDFSAIEPGPLADNVAGTFAGGRYQVVTLDKDIVLYRAGTADQPLGQFFGAEAPSGVLQTRVDKAVLPVWPGGAQSPIDTAFEVKVPSGTQVYVGEVGSQGGAFVGGTEQIVVLKPWTIDGVEVLNSGPLK